MTFVKTRTDIDKTLRLACSYISFNNSAISAISFNVLIVLHGMIHKYDFSRIGITRARVRERETTKNCFFYDNVYAYFSTSRNFEHLPLPLKARQDEYDESHEVGYQRAIIPFVEEARLFASLLTSNPQYLVTLSLT